MLFKVRERFWGDRWEGGVKEVEDGVQMME